MIDNKLFVLTRGITFLWDKEDRLYDLSKSRKKCSTFFPKFRKMEFTFLSLQIAFLNGKSHGTPENNSKILSFPTRYVTTL